MRRFLVSCALAGAMGCAGLVRGFSQTNLYLTPDDTEASAFQRTPQLIQFYLDNADIILTQSFGTTEKTQVATGGTVIDRSKSRNAVDIVHIKMTTPLVYVAASKDATGRWRDVTLDAGAGILLTFAYTGKCPLQCWPDIYTRMQPVGEPEFTLSAVNGASLSGEIPLDGRTYKYSTPESSYPPSIAFWRKWESDDKQKTTERTAPGKKVP